MTQIKSKLILYALLALSLSLFLSVCAKGDVCRNICSNYFLYNKNGESSGIREIFLKSYFYFNADTKRPDMKNEIPEIKSTDDNEIISDDKNIMFESRNCRGLEFYNETDYTIDEQSLLAEKPDFKAWNESMPQILIIHTHASESYSYKRTYPLTDTDRTQDPEYNMVRVGAELKNELTERGYNVIHDCTVHDYPSYTSSYQRAGETIKGYLDKYPSITAVFDIHRDAVINSDGKNIGLVSMQNGEECAQVMIVCGTDQNKLEFDAWEENLRFAFKIQDYMQKKYPGIMRPLNIRRERFNLHLTKGSLLFEIGTNGNSLNQALNSVRYLADGIDKTLQNISKSY